MSQSTNAYVLSAYNIDLLLLDNLPILPSDDLTRNLSIS
jgi:hypothetical protein